MASSIKICEILFHISEKTKKNEKFITGIGVNTGLAGLSIYHYLNYQLFNDSKSRSLGEYYLNKTFEKLNSDYVSRNIYRELNELGTWIELANKYKYFETDTNDILNPFDNLLDNEMRININLGNFDPITGFLGFGHYFLIRLNSKIELKAILNELLISIHKLEKNNDKGTYWISRLKQEPLIYLGFSHGCASILNFLTELSRRNILPVSIDLIKNAAYFLIKNELKDDPLIYPVILGKKNNKKIYPNSWCYGDLGVIYALLKASILLKDLELYDHVLGHLREISSRPKGYPYLDAGSGILYGTSGRAMLYHEMYEITKEIFLLNAYENQIEQIISSFNSKDEFLGYKAYWNQEMPHTNWAMSDGLIGIASTLMIYLNKDYKNIIYPFFHL